MAPSTTSTNTNTTTGNNKQVWLITGCKYTRYSPIRRKGTTALTLYPSTGSTGFGHHLTVSALSRGYHVIATSRNPSNLKELSQLGAETLALDPSWPLEDLRTTIDSALSRHGRIDVLINNAAFVLQGALEELTPADDLAAFTVNVFGPMNMMRCVLPYMRKQRSGTIINIGSLAGWEGTAGLAEYNGTKFALAGVTESVALETKDFGIRVVCVEPGYFRTSLLEGKGAYRRAGGREMPEYAAARETNDRLGMTNGKQPGDPVKGAETIVRFIETEGELPMRWVMGRDVREAVEKKWEEHHATFEKWKAITDATAFDE